MNNREKLVAKIRALLSKTVDNGCTEAEAMSALNMAQAMMDAYEVTDDDLDMKGEEAIIDTSDKFDPHNIRRAMAVWICRFCDVKPWSPRGSKHGLTFCGLRSDVDFAMWLLDSLSEFVMQQLSWHLMIHQPAKHEKKLRINSFCAGCCNRINERLKELVEARQPKTSNSQALVVLKNDLITKKMNELGIHLRTRYGFRDYSAGDYMAGKKAGEGASFGRPVGQSNVGVLRIGKQ